jgi:hypothetical protein
MSPSLIRLVHGSATTPPGAAPTRAALAARSPAMTIRVITASPRRTDPLAGHTYSIPVVRELPKPPAEPVGDHTW